MRDPGGGRETRLALDLCLRIGELLLSSGAGAADVVTTMRAVGAVYGLRPAEVDVTFTSLTMSVQGSADEPMVLLVRQVSRRTIDYADLTAVDDLTRQVLGGGLDLREARNVMARIVSSDRATPRWAITLGWGAMSGGVAVLLGGNPAVVTIAFFAAICIDRLLLVMSHRKLPLFYQQVGGGIVASFFAVLALSAGVVDNPSRTVTANIVMLLAGIGFVGAVQDALTGFLLTAGARFTEALLATAGIIAGVGGGLSAGQALGVDINKFNPGAAGTGTLGQVLIGGAICAAAFGFASYSPPRALPAIAVTSALALGVQRGLVRQDLTQSWATALAALTIGLLGYPLSRSLRVPPLVILVPAIVPMLPGLAIYRGLALLNGGGARASEGLLSLVTAAALALALASGAIFGQYLAQPLAHRVRRVEARLAGPRLLGPLAPWRPARFRRGPEDSS